MTNKYITYMTVSVFLFGTFDAFSEVNATNYNVPKGFEDLVKPKKQNLKIVLAADNTLDMKGKFLITGDRVVYIGKPEILEKKLIEKLDIVAEESKRITKKLVEGVDSSIHCVGFRSQCPLSPEHTDYVYVPDKQSLILHINPKWMKSFFSKTPNNYISDHLDESALIMNHELSYSQLKASQDEDESDYNYSYYNNSYLGLSKFNFLHSSVNYNSSNGVSADDISFNHLQKNTRFRIGYIDKNISWNNTSFLDSDTPMSGYIASFGSTNELRRSSEISKQRIYFNSPRSGRLEVKNSQGRVLVSRNVKAGQQYLSYDELPKGSYSIIINVFDGESSVFTDNRVIINNDPKDGSVGDIDYTFSTGYLSLDLTNTKEHDIDNGQEKNYDEYESPIFSDVKVSSQMTERLNLGLGVMSTSDDYYVYGGFNYWLFDSGNLSTVGGIFNDNSAFYNVNLSLASFSASWRHFDSGDFANDVDDINLSQLLSSGGNFDSLYSSYYYTLTNNSSIYLSGSLNHNTISDGVFDDENRSWSVNTGYTVSGLFANSQLTLELGVLGDDDVDNDYTTKINIVLPLGSDHTYIHDTFINKKGTGNTEISHRDTLSSTWLHNEDISLSTDVGTYYSFDNSVENETDLSASVAANNDYLSGSAYFYMDSQGARSDNIFLKSTSITTNEHTVLTDKSSDSYLFIENKSGDLDKEGKFLSVVQGRKDNKIDSTIPISKGQSLEPIGSYSEYEFVVDDDAADFQNSGDSGKKATSSPGTVIHLQTQLGELKTFISTFVDIQDKNVESVECVGDGCVSTEEITSGVYQFKVKTNLPYMIVSHKNQCVIPDIKESASGNLGQNFCMPTFEDTLEGYEFAKFNSDEYYYYIGKFSALTKVNDYKDKLANSKIKFVEKNIGKFTYVFVKTDRMLIAENLDNILQLMSYAAVDDETLIPYASN